MKIRNIEVGSYIQSKKDSKQLIAGHCYQVVEKDVSDKTVRLFSVDDSFDDSLWFCVSDFRKPKPLLKQLDQSIFDGLDEKWRFAAVDRSGEVWYSTYKTQPTASGTHLPPIGLADSMQAEGYYDASNWQNSSIERDTAKELTGSELCKAMLARGDKFILCGVSDGDDSDAANHEDDDFLAEAVTDFDDTDGLFGTASMRWIYAVPINNQGEPLTAAEAGL